MDGKKAFLIILAIIIIIVAVVAVVNPFHVSFTSSSSSEVSAGSIVYENGKLTIKDETFTIPQGYEEVENESEIDGDGSAFADGAKLTFDTFKNGNDTLIIKVVYFNNDSTFTELNQDANTENRTYGNISGVLTQKDGIVAFDYLSDGKIVEIVAPNEDVLSAIFS